MDIFQYKALAKDASRKTRVTLQVVLFLAAVAIVVSRRPDAVLNAQFFA
jgi:hypothetical protein